MSTVRITPSVLEGSVTVPASKSAAHRALICSFLSGGGSLLHLDVSEDINATQNALRALAGDETIVDCNESGSTLRFMIPIAAALGKSVTFVGSGKLPIRPIGEYLRLLPAHGVKCEYDGRLPLHISGRLTSGSFEIAGDVSSQYITGLLLALPLLDGDSEIVLTTALQSKPYVDLTVRMMADFDVSVTETESGYFVRGNQKYTAREYTVEGDWSQAAFFLAGGAIAGEVEVRGLDMASAQGDKQIVDVKALWRRYSGRGQLREGKKSRPSRDHR